MGMVGAISVWDTWYDDMIWNTTSGEFESVDPAYFNTSPIYDTQYLDDMHNNTVTDGNTSIFGITDFGTLDIIEKAGMFFTILKAGRIDVILTGFGIPDWFASPVQILCDIIVIFGVVQFISGRSSKAMG